jgi:DNA-binding transcriptional MerR regulator
MLRYIERAGLVEPARSDAGYRLYGPPELQKLRTLRELLQDHEVGLTDIGFALRLRRDADLRDAVEAWLRAEAQRPVDVPADNWLRWEQEKHQRLLRGIAPDTGNVASAQRADALLGAVAAAASTTPETA